MDAVRPEMVFDGFGSSRVGFGWDLFDDDDATGEEGRPSVLFSDSESDAITLRDWLFFLRDDEDDDPDLADAAGRGVLDFSASG